MHDTGSSLNSNIHTANDKRAATLYQQNTDDLKKKTLKVRSVCFGTDGSETRIKTNDVSQTVEQNFVISLAHLTSHRTNAVTHSYAGLFQRARRGSDGSIFVFLTVITINHLARITTNCVIRTENSFGTVNSII